MLQDVLKVLTYHFEFQSLPGMETVAPVLHYKYAFQTQNTENQAVAHIRQRKVTVDGLAINPISFCCARTHLRLG